MQEAVKNSPREAREYLIRRTIATSKAVLV